MAHPGASPFRTAAVLWLAAGLTPFLAIIEHGLTPGAVTCLLAWFAGWAALAVGGRRRRDQNALAGSWRHAPVRAGTLSLLALGQLIAVLGTGLALPVTLMTVAALGLALWSLSSGAAKLAGACARILLLATGLLVAAGLAELVSRTGPVVERTGGSVSQRRQTVAERYDQLWTANRYGLRSFHVDAPKPEGWLRVLTLGDSFTWGDQVARTADTWPYVLEQTLRRHGMPVQVLNLAEPGFTTVNSTERLEQIGWAMAPDAVVLQFGLNDPLPSRHGGRAVGEGWLFPTWPLPPDIPAVRDHSYLWALLNDHFTGWQMRARHPRGYAPLFEEDAPGWRACRTALSEMSAAASQREVPLLVALFPALDGPLDDVRYRYLDLHEEVRAACAAASLPVLDLRPHLAHVDPDPDVWRSSPWDAHPGEQTHALAGAVVAQHLLRMARPQPAEE